MLTRHDWLNIPILRGVVDRCCISNIYLHDIHVMEIGKVQGEYGIPIFYKEDVMKFLGVRENLERVSTAFTIVVDECPICFLNRHLVPIQCLGDHEHAVCAECVKDI